mmetsp:Transcript_109197/g.315519  ORF Transcript_109197/g.315519 Transcript_109197/m.315519 type:complete len:267 (+) Transcript_109197:57-857(+)
MGGVCSFCDDDVGHSRLETVVGDVQKIDLAGRWVSARGHIHYIGLDQIKWSSGDLTAWYSQRSRVDGVVEFCTTVNGEVFAARLDEDDRLRWTDGDTWTRDEVGPTTGTYDTVTSVLTKARGEIQKVTDNERVSSVLSKARGSMQMVTDSTMTLAAPVASAIGSKFQTKPATRDDASSPGAASTSAGPSWDGSPSGDHGLQGFHEVPDPGDQHESHGDNYPHPFAGQDHDADSLDKDLRHVTPRPKRRVAPSASSTAPRGTYDEPE